MNHNLSQITNYFQYNDQLAAGGQPTAEQLEIAKNEGFEAIVNISTPSARNFLHEEAQVVETLGMDYFHFPVDCSNLRPVHFTAFKNIMNALEGKKVFVHCGGNIKTSNLLHMYHVIEGQAKESESLEILKKIQQPEPKWFEYFKSFGMIGLS